VLELGAQVALPAPRQPLRRGSASARVDELVQCVGEQVSLADRGEKREGGNDRLGYDPSDHRLRFEPRREPPQTPAGAAELRHDGFLGQRDECAQCLDAELQQPAMRVGVEREHGEPLGGEELLLLPARTITAVPGRARVAATQENEFPLAPPHTCGMWNAECGNARMRFVGRATLH